jgi:hypothetical protein
MRWFRALFLVGLCLFWGASAVTADEVTSATAGQTASPSGSFLSQLGMALAMLWEESGCRIDPWGVCSAAEGAPTGDDSDSLSTDEGCRIDPWGSCRNGQ